MRMLSVAPGHGALPCCAQGSPTQTPWAPTIQPGPGLPGLKLHAERPKPQTTTTSPGAGGLVTPLGHAGPTPHAESVSAFAPCGQGSGTHARLLLTSTPGNPA